jgi:RHS repeat-associated protein
MRETRPLPLKLVTAFFVASALLFLTLPLAASVFCNNPFTPPDSPPASPPACGGGCAGGGAGGGGAGRRAGATSSGSPGTSCCDNCTESPCYVASGVYETKTVDLELPTQGFPLSAARKYQSSHTIDGPTGYGWTTSLAAHLYYAAYLLAAPSTYQKEADITMPDGARYRFADNGNGTFASPANRHDTLVKNGDGTWDLMLQWSLSVLHFNADGSLASQRDDYGNALSYSYDGSGRLQQVADASGSGSFLNVFWGADGRMSSVLDSAGRQINYYYDARGVLTSASDPLVRLTQYTYAQGRFVPLLTSITDNWNRVVSTITYDTADRVHSYTENGETFTYSYKYQGDPTETAKADSQGNTWVFRYSVGGPVVDEIPPVGTGGGTVHKDYYADSSLQQRVDAVGVRTYYTYDTQGQIATVTDDYQGASAVRFDRTYDPNFPARLTSETPRNPSTGSVDPNWQAWRSDYYQTGDPAPGARHHVYHVESDGVTLDTMATYAFDSHGRLTSTTDADGGTTSYAYDAQGDLVSTTAPLNNDAGTPPVTSYAYDAAGRPTAVTDPMGNVTSTTYDAVDRELTRTLPPPAANSQLDFTTHYSYDNYDNATGLVFTRITDPNGNTTQQGFDTYGRLIEAIDALGAVTAYTYLRDLLVSETDANGNVTHYGYDGLKRLTTITFPDGAQETYTYFADGLRQTKADRKNQAISDTYDHFKRLVTRTYPGGATIAYTYQGSKLMQVVDGSVSPSETHAFNYDASYRVATETQGPRGTLTFTYTPAGRRASYAVGGGASAAYTFYPDGSLDTIQWSPVSGAFKYAYDLRGRTQQITFPNGQHRDYTYDAQGRLVQLASVHPTAGNLATYRYGYDVDNATALPGMLGQRTSLTANAPAQGLLGALTKYYYDRNYQLTGADYPSAPPFNSEVDRWTYDAIGNRATATVNGVVSTYSYAKNGTNSLSGQRLTSDGANTYAYDANGSMISKVSVAGQLSATWNVERRLVALSGTTSAYYGYDYKGRRVTKTAGGMVSYIYLDSQLVASTAGEEYLYGRGTDNVLAVVKSGQVDYYSEAALGTVTLLSDGSSNVGGSYVTDVWGRQLAASGAATNVFGYTGREFNEDGTYYYRARYYDPRLGRFTEEDPSHYVGALYAYADNNPVIERDPAGLDGKECDCKKGPTDQDGYNCSIPCRDNPKVHQEKGDAARCGACIKCCSTCHEYRRKCGRMPPDVNKGETDSCLFHCNYYCLGEDV